MKIYSVGQADGQQKDERTDMTKPAVAFRNYAKAPSRTRRRYLEAKSAFGTHQLLAYADDVNILGGSIHTYLLTYLLHGAESFLRS